MNYSGRQINELVESIFEGYTNIYNLPKNLYLKTADYLKEALYKGYGSEMDYFAYNTTNYKLLNEMRNNIYLFSGAKTYTQIKEMQSFMTKDNKGLDFKKFKENALNTYEKYNVNYLASEYTTSITSGTNAVIFKDATENKELFPQLKYVAIIDSLTSDECKRLNGTIADTIDPFWHIHSPPMHWNCRCSLEKISVYDNKKSKSKVKLDLLANEIGPKIQDTFKMNSGLDKEIFKKNHPYFKVSKKDKDYAKRNFDLIIPKKD
jgi:SPP1 gp7 family putative phage head morphogenesis protein